MAHVIEKETQVTKWKGPLGPGRYTIQRFGDSLLLGILHNEAGCYYSIWLHRPEEVICLIRDLQHAVDTIQPGTFLPLPDNDPDWADAMILLDRADRLEQEQK